MEVSVITKLLEISLTVCILIVIYFRNEKKYDKRENDYKEFTNQVLEDNKKREENYIATINKNQEVIGNLTSQLDIVIDIKTTVENLESDVKELKNELK